jgi:hypothetical protein
MRARMQYTGDWQDGKMNGEGTYTYADGDEYKCATAVAARVWGGRHTQCLLARGSTGRPARTGIPLLR